MLVPSGRDTRGQSDVDAGAGFSGTSQAGPIHEPLSICRRLRHRPSVTKHVFMLWVVAALVFVTILVRRYVRQTSCRPA